jgi:hypothetical protein
MKLALINNLYMENPVSAAPKVGGNKIAWFVALIVLIGVIVALNNVGEKDAKSSLEEEVSEKTEEVAGEKEVVALNDSKVVVSTDADMALPYTAAYTKYAGRRIEFSSKCQVSPVKAEFKDGTKVMLDNRGSVSRRIAVGDQAFVIPAYNFAFLTLTAEKLPMTYSVDCGTAAGVASVTVTK